MTVGIRIKLPGVTEEQFDEVNKHIDPKGNPPKGILFHSSGPIDGGWGVIDFWESRDAFDSFVQERLMPRLHGLGDRGFPNPPDVKEFPVHNLQMP
jgi:hypothetical protein